MTKKPKGKYVLVSEGVYLLNLRKAVLGKGLAGGGFTTDLKKAKRYPCRRNAERDAGSIYQGIVVEVGTVR